jgi:hypothetical protein
MVIGLVVAVGVGALALVVLVLLLQRPAIVAAPV